MTREEIKQMANTCNQYHSCAACPYNPEDISRFIGDRWKGGCPNYDRKLVYAMGKGYGDVSEYEAERELLGSKIRVLKQRLNNKYIEVDNLNRDYHNSFERLKAQEREIMQLKAENARLTGRLGQVLLAVDTVKEMNAMCDIDDQRKQAVKEFAEKLKGKLHDFGDGGEKGAYITEKDIDELLKEYENGKDKD